MRKVPDPNYYPFGSVMQGRSYSSGAYRFGFNNQEKDGELGEAYAFEYRIHDARLGRFLSIDPLLKKFPFYSPFQFCSNNVILSVDIEGLESSSAGINKNEELYELDEGKLQGTGSSGALYTQRGEISYSSPGIQKRVGGAINQAIEVKRGFFGRIFNKNNYKTVENPKFEPALAEAVTGALIVGNNICFTDDPSVMAGDVAVNGIVPSGACFKTGDKNYTLYVSKESGSPGNLMSTGTDPLFEEIFHMDNYINGEIPLTSNNLVPGDRRLDDEALAKHKVISRIQRNLTYNYYQEISIDKIESGTIYTCIYVETSFGAMKGMSVAEIKEFISTNRDRMYNYNVFEVTYDSFGIPNARQQFEAGRPKTGRSTKPQEGAYDFLR